MQTTEKKYREDGAKVNAMGPLDPPAPGAAGTSQDRARAEDRLKAVEDALSKVLSADSMRFLQEFQQEGGQ